MIDSIEWLRAFIMAHSSVEYLIVFAGAAFGGELALFTFGFLVVVVMVQTFYCILK